ncbi:MAG: crossover junction endodeoxyribonuclease RuvC [Desulfomonilia bacterium]|jgi:crossover junction endodeoxyribonuclease RuvC
MIICGIDPGMRATGYGVLEIRDTPRNTLAYVAHGTIRPRAGTLDSRLKEIFLQMTRIFREHRPQEVAIETTFHALNVQSALKLGQARGAVILAASLLDIPVFEYTPTEIKKATCGYGRAGKEQVAAVITSILRIPRGSVDSSDATDALAIGLCHSSSRRMRELTR